MRTRIGVVAALVGLGLLAVGCGDTAPTNDMAPAPDMAVAVDLASPPDLTLIPDLRFIPDLRTTRDLTPTPDMPGYSATIILAEYSTAMLVGGQSQLVKVVNPVVGFNTSANAKAPDYNSVTNPNVPVGCIGNHYDLAANDTPEAGIAGGDVVLTGFKPGIFLFGGVAPSSITCKWDAARSAYACVYTGTTFDTAEAPFALTTDTIPAGAILRYTGTANGPFGSFDVSMQTPAGPITTAENLSTITWDPTRDVSLTVQCPYAPSMQCFAMVLVTLSIGGKNTNTSGAVRCTQLGVAGTIKIEQKALAAAFGCQPDGTMCDANLRGTGSTVRTVVLHVPVTSNSADSNGNVLTLLGGHGVIAQVTRQ